MKTDRLTAYELSDAAFALRLRRTSVAEGKKFWEEAFQIESQPQHLRRMLKQQSAMYADLRIDPMVLHGHPLRRLDEFEWDRPVAAKEAPRQAKASPLRWKETAHGEINPVNGLQVGIPQWLGRPD